LGFAGEKNNLLAPSASIAGNASVCRNATGVAITFTGSGGTAPYTFTYTVSGTPGNQTIQTTSGNSVTVAVPTGTVGTFIYTLVSVRDSVTTAEQNASGTATVIVSAPPNVNFTFTNDDTCSGTAIQFTSNVTGTGPYTYSWDFGDGSPLSTAINPIHSFTSLGCGNATFNVTLTITGGGCTVARSYSVRVKQKPDISFSDTANLFDPFSNCSNASTNPVFSINVGNNSTSTCISSFSINWGDGNIQNNITFPISHTYNSTGAYSMVISAIGTNGCSNSKTYIIKNVSNPLGGINSPGSTQNLCAPTANLQFSISNWGSNSLDTTYTINYGDSTPLLLLTQAQMNSSTYYNSSNPSSSTNYPIPHIYTTSSCPATSFVVTLDVTNACGTTPFTLGNISILTKPTANFIAPIKGCVNTGITFTNTTIAGYSQGCVQSSIYTWNFGDGTPTITTPLSPPQNINHTYTVPGNYTVTLTAQNGCGTSTKTQQVCIEPPLVPQFTLNNNTGCIPFTVTATNTTSLVNQCGAPTYQWTVSYAAGFCGTTSAFTYTGGTSATSASPSFNFTEAGTYTITLTASNSCTPAQTTTQVITVKKPPTITSINGVLPNYCGNANISPTAVIPACAMPGILSYAWTFTGGTPLTSNSATPGPINYPAGGPYTVSLIVSNECGNSLPATQTFSVNIAPVITNTSLSQTICSGSTTSLVNLTANPTGTTFSWTATATAGISGFTPSGTTNTIPAQTITTTNTSPGTVTYVITPSVGGCPGPPVNYVITVNPAPTITTQPASSAVCLGGTPTPLTVALNSSSVTPTYQWYSNTSLSTSGGTLIPGATNATYNPPATTAVTLYYYCIISLSSGGCSGLTSAVATVTVNPLPTITTQPLATQSICVGGTIAALTVAYTGGLGTATYQWYSNTSNATTGGTPVGTNSASFTPAAFTTAGTFYYYVTISLSGNGCGTVTSTSAQIVVVADPVVTGQPLATQTLCQNATASVLTVAASGGLGSYTYQWYSNGSASITGATLIPSAVSASYTPSTATVGTTYYFCIISQTSLGCSVNSAFAVVIVNASPTIQNQPVSSTVCVGGVPTPLSLTFINGVGTPTYQWYSNGINSNVGGTLLTGETNPTFSPPASTASTIYYYCIITFPAITGSCAIVTSNPATVTIDAGAVINLQPLANQSLCVGATIPNPFTVTFSGGTGTPSYQWYSNTNNSTTGGTPVGTNLASYTPPVFNTPGTYYYYVVISLNGSGCGNITSQVAQVIVVSDPSITTQPLTTQTQCQSSAATPLVVVASGGIGTFTYQWYSNSSPSNSGGNIISGATTDTYLPPTTAVGTVYYYCVITQTGVGCNVTSAFATVIVVPSPIITSQPQSATVCAGAVIAPLTIAYSNGTGTASYQWYDDNGLIVGATNASYTPTNTVTANFYCIITFSSGGCTNITSNSATITINPVPAITQQPTPTQSVCVGGGSAPLTVSYSGGVGTVSYQWYSNTNSSATGGTPVGTDLPSYTPPAFTVSGQYYYYVVISFSSGGCGSVTSAVAQVDVVPDPTVTTQPLPTQTVCQNSPATILSVIASGGIGTTYNYQWYSSTVNNTASGTLLAGETNSTYSPPTSIAGTLYYYCIITQLSGIGCNVTSAVAAVTVNLAPAVVNQPPSSTICLGATPTILSLTYVNGAGTPNYQWYSNTTNSNSGGTLIPGATNATFNPPATPAGTVYYYCEVTFPSIVGSCSLITTAASEVTINQNPVIASETTVICSSTTFTLSPSTTSGNIIPLGTTYTWTTPVINPAGSITGAASETVPQTSISQTLVNTTTSPATATYTVIPTSGICPGNSFTVTVTVNPSINPNVVVTNNACFGVNTASISTNITGGIPFSSGSPYQLSWTGPNSFTSSATSISNIEPGTYNVTIADAGGCPFSNSYTITEPADIVITVDSENDITCYSANNGSINISVTGGTGAYSYNWTKNTVPYAITEDISNLAPGTYEVSVTDVNNCGPRIVSFTITEPPLLVVSLVSQTNVLCYGAATGAINVNVTGGTPGAGYNFSWVGPNGFTSTNQILTAIPAGNYDLTVTDANGCIKNLSVIITQSTEIIIAYTTTPITCYGANNASMSITLSGGNPAYQFQWSNLSTSLTQTNLSAGNYTITVTDNVGCIKTETIVIPEAPIFTINPIVTQISCNGANNGSINLNLTGGIAPVALTWSDGNTAGLIRNNLSPGTYTATISDGTPCFIVRTFTIIQPLPLVLSANLTNSFDCTIANTGAIDLVVAGGTLPYSYSWSNGATIEDLSNLTSGNYLVNVTDANGCRANAQYPIIRQDPIVITVATQTDFDCDARTVNQQFVAQVSGGIPPYQLQWSSGTISGANNEIMQTNSNGTVLLTVTDSNNCTATYTVIVDTPILGYPSFDTTSFGYTTYGLFAIGDPIQFTNTATGDFVSVLWDFGDGTFSTELNPIHTYTIAKDYIVTLTVTYPFGCVYVQTISLFVEEGYVLVVPTAFTPNNDTLNDTMRPVTRRLKNVQMDIYDTWGSLIYSETGDVLVGWDAKIKGFNAENGNYYCKVKGETFYGTTVYSNQTFVLIK
jgi:gliding motility-associated-like protein